MKMAEQKKMQQNEKKMKLGDYNNMQVQYQNRKKDLLNECATNKS